MDKKSLINYIFVYFSCFLFMFICYVNVVDISYVLSALFFLFLFVITLFNKDEKYKYNTCIFIYMAFIISMTLFLNRLGIGLINKEHYSYYTNAYNLIPFRTIYDFFTYGYSLIEIVYNIVGNLIVFVPISLILMFKDKKYMKVKNQILYLFIFVSLVEVLQYVLSVGRFDVDDYILNILGCIIFIKVYSLLKLDRFKIEFKSFNIIYPLILFIIVFDVYLVSHFINYTNRDDQVFYVVPRVNCNGYRESLMPEHSIYLNCIRVYYKDENKYVSVAGAYQKGILDNDKVMSLLEEESVLDKTYSVYKDNEVKFIFCDNESIYITYSVVDDYSVCEIKE